MSGKAGSTGTRKPAFCIQHVKRELAIGQSFLCILEVFASTGRISSIKHKIFRRNIILVGARTLLSALGPRPLPKRWWRRLRH